MTIDDLIALLEKAEAPSRELDQAIHLLVLPDDLASKIIRGDMKVHEWSLGMGGICWRSDSGSSGGTWPVRHYSSSIDAALTLVPDGFYGRLWFGPRPPHMNDVPVAIWSSDTQKMASFFGPNGDHQSPAIALCIAALKARKEQP